MRVIIEKHERRLTVFEGEREVFRCRAALGREPEGPKQREGDGRTPEGVYAICLVKERGKYGRSLGLSYPGMHDAQAALARGEIDREVKNIIDSCYAKAKELIVQNEDVLHKSARLLLEKEKIGREEFEGLFSDGGAKA